jgi:ABC-type multidrug transport system ATPase subunit
VLAIDGVEVTAAAGLKVPKSKRGHYCRGLYQLPVLLKKRWWFTKRDKRSLIASVLVPLGTLAVLGILPSFNIGAGFVASGGSVDTGVSATPSARTMARVQEYDNEPTCDVFTGSFRLSQCCNEFEACKITGRCSISKCCNFGADTSPYYGCDPSSANGGCLLTGSMCEAPCYNAHCAEPKNQKLGATVEMMVAILLIQVAFTFMIASAAATVVREREAHQNSKHLQLVCGTSQTAYWLSFYLWDLMWALLPVGLCTGLLSGLLIFSTAPSEALPLAFLVLLGFVMCALPLSYLQASFYTNYATAQNGVFIFNIVTGVLFTIFAFIFNNVPICVADCSNGGSYVLGVHHDERLTLVRLYEEYLKYPMLLCPQFALYRGLYVLGTTGYATPGIVGVGEDEGWSVEALAKIKDFSFSSGFSLLSSDVFPFLLAGALLLLPFHIMCDWFHTSATRKKLAGLCGSKGCLSCWTPSCCTPSCFSNSDWFYTKHRDKDEAVNSELKMGTTESPDGQQQQGQGMVLAIDSVEIDGAAAKAEIAIKVKAAAKAEKDAEEDEDVKAERARVECGEAEEAGDLIVLNKMRKVYGGNKVAVKATSLGVPQGQCFGLLGINGAGKTTTMKMLTGDILVTDGSAKLAGYDVSKQQQEARKHLGYCPQFDALLVKALRVLLLANLVCVICYFFWHPTTSFPRPPLPSPPSSLPTILPPYYQDGLTVTEHLTLFATLKVQGGTATVDGKEASIKEMVESKIVQIGLAPFRTKLANSLSGGNKRKVSLAIALIGEPEIVFLDEPSTGMDPVSRRTMWDVLADVCTQGNTAMVLTTHSMEECEALCSRIGIMVGGALRCIGTSQHLKARFGDGYQIDLRLAVPEVSTMEAAMAKFPKETKTVSAASLCVLVLIVVNLRCW